MIAWLKQNGKTIGAISALVALYAIKHFAPMREDERQLLAAVCELLGLFTIGAVPAFARIERDK